MITAPRGLYSNPTKVDRYPTSYFKNDFLEDRKRLDNLAEAANKAHEEKINQVRYKKSDEYKKGNFKPKFKPSGPKEFKDL